MDTVPDGLKFCKGCGEVRPRAAFSLRKGRKNGLQHRCKLCTAVYRRAKADLLKANRRRTRDAKAAYDREFKKPRTPDQIRQGNHRRRARILEASGTHSAHDIKTKYEEQSGHCYWCGVDLESTYHVDHIIPLARGGSNGPENICCSCPLCNMRKADKMPWEFSDRLF